jgi:hypothetical protein
VKGLEKWQSLLRYDPLPQLLSSKNQAIILFTKRDLRSERSVQVETLWKLPIAVKTVERQQSDGSWKYHGGKPDIRSQQNYNQLETYRILGELVEKYGFNNKHAVIRKAADFLLKFQTSKGDFRGIYGNQYSPNYTAAITELLIKAGYENDPHTEKGFRWLLSGRQNDGGWAIASRTKNIKIAVAPLDAEAVQPDRTRSFSHRVTGVVLRAFAAHSKYRSSSEAKAAGELLTSRFFKRDVYPDRAAVGFWTKISYPFWFTDLLSSLDSLSLLGFKMEDQQVKNAIEWFVDKHDKSGLWKGSILRGKDKDLNLWICLAICRVLRRFCTNTNSERYA